MSPAPAPSHLGSVSSSLLPPTGYFGDTDRDDGRYPPRPRPPAGTCGSSGGVGGRGPPYTLSQWLGCHRKLVAVSL